MMAERVNTMSYEAATPQVTQMLIDLLNNDVTPEVESRGSPGEGDLPQMGNVEATMVGVGEAYYHGVEDACVGGVWPTPACGLCRTSRPRTRPQGPRSRPTTRP